MNRRIGEWRRHLLPWAGLIGAGTGWALSQQIGSNSIVDDCLDSGWWVVLLAGIAGLGLALAGGFAALKVWRHDDEETEARRFVALLGGMAALLFSLAILLQTAAGLIIPRCYG